MLALLGLILASCTTTENTGSTTTSVEGSTPETTAVHSGPPEEDSSETDQVVMARADQATGYFQAYVYKALLEELGYEVTDPAANEMGPSLAYPLMAAGEVDFWVNGHMPGHLHWFDTLLEDGSLVGNHLTVFGPVPDSPGEHASSFTGSESGELVDGVSQGYLITKSFAERYGITTMDELNASAAALAAFDEVDPDPGNGMFDIYGCQVSFTCDNIIQNQIVFSGWANIQQRVVDSYELVVVEAIDKVSKNLPMVIYAWTPSTYVAQLIPGENVVWLGVDGVLDDSNPSGERGGEGHDQRPGTANIDPDRCPSAAQLGFCRLGWLASDILVTANNDFLSQNPAAAKLFELVSIPVLDVSRALLAQDADADAGEALWLAATDWIAKNREIVDTWLSVASAAG